MDTQTASELTDTKTKANAMIVHVQYILYSTHR